LTGIDDKDQCGSGRNPGGIHDLHAKILSVLEMRQLDWNTDKKE
jgi:hypothetical protein